MSDQAAGAVTEVEARAFPLSGTVRPMELVRRLYALGDLVCCAGEWSGGAVLIAWRASQRIKSRDPFGQLDLLPRVARRDEDCLIGGGWFGYIGYGCRPTGRREDEPANLGLPHSSLRWYDNLLRWDPHAEQWWFECLWEESRADRLHKHLTEAQALLNETGAPTQGYSIGRLAGPDPASHMRAVEEVLTRIHQGQLFQANVCTRFAGDFQGAPASLFAAGVDELAPAFAGLVHVTPTEAVVSFSPELFLRREEDVVTVAPIKGTRPRTGDFVTDEVQAQSLRNSTKDAAENVMIVDLMRNDLSRTAVNDSVQVPQMLALEPHPNVWHLVSYVQSRIANTTSSGSLLKSLFPPGSVTGAPKLAAMNACDGVEAFPRNAYTGVLGYISPLRRAEFNVLIRTFEVQHERIWIGTGGGITANSDPAAEWAECLVKVNRLIERLGGTVATGDVPGPFVETSAVGTAPEIFDTAEARYGVIVDGEAHLYRLLSSASGSDTSSRMRSAFCPEVAHARARVRSQLVVEPQGSPLRQEVAPLKDSASQSLRLAPVIVEGYDYHAKTSDRQQLEALERAAPLGYVPLLISTDGHVLESTRSNVFIVNGQTIATPATEGRVLAGVTRRRVLLLADQHGYRTEIRRVHIGELKDAEAVFVTNSLIGIANVAEVAGVRRAGAGTDCVRRVEQWYSAWREAYVQNSLLVRAMRRRFASAAPLHVSQAWQPLPGAAASRLLIVDNYDSFTHNLVHRLHALGARTDVVLNDDGRDIDIDDFDGLVVSPGPGSPASAGRSMSLIEQFAAHEKAVLGVCLGHQCIGAVFGCDVEPISWPRHGMASDIWHDGSTLFRGLAQPFSAARYHSLGITATSSQSDLRVTAVSEDDVVMAVEHQRLAVYGVQFHPESIITPAGDRLLCNFLHSIPRRHHESPAQRSGPADQLSRRATLGPTS